MKVEVFYQSESVLGEGPAWNSKTDELLWVDIEEGQLNLFHPSGNSYKKYNFDSRLGAAVPTDRAQYLLALENGLAIFDPNTEQLNYFNNPEIDLPNNRFNDGKCDPQGRFWIGSMDRNAANEKGSLYRVDSDLKVHVMLSNVSISNGLAWDTNHQKMYFIDTAKYQVLQFDYDSKSGAIRNPKKVIYIPKNHGAPDGMTIDREGMLWIAHWGGANISRWNPFNGQPLQKVIVPAPHVTSCCFGGKALDQLYITTARYGLSAQQLKEYPLSGSVFIFSPKVGGRETNYFNDLE